MIFVDEVRDLITLKLCYFDETGTVQGRFLPQIEYERLGQELEVTISLQTYKAREIFLGRLNC